MTVILVTGAAGFIGSHVAMRLLEDGHGVVGVDRRCDAGLERARLERFVGHPRYVHVHADLADRDAVERVFAEHAPARVVHLAAQAGVHQSAVDPHGCIANNVTAFLHVLEGCRAQKAAHLVFASSSSVYGANRGLPFSEHGGADHPLTLYGASKKANEAMAHGYAHLHGVPCTGLRFFTVYGPWGRPDMAPALFARAILAGEPLRVFNHGRHRRSFTYIDDIVEATVRILGRAPEADPGWNGASPDPAASGVGPYRLYNIGHEQPVELLRFIRLLEAGLGREARLEMLPLQPGDVPDTEADVSGLVAATGYRPRVTVEDGVKRFVDWYRAYHGR